MSSRRIAPNYANLKITRTLSIYGTMYVFGVIFSSLSSVTTNAFSLSPRVNFNNETSFVGNYPTSPDSWLPSVPYFECNLNLHSFGFHRNQDQSQSGPRVQTGGFQVCSEILVYSGRGTALSPC